MRTRFLFTVLFICIALGALSQKDVAAYKQRAAQVEAEVWGKPSKEFMVTGIPAGMDSESAVIIATSVEMINSANIKKEYTAIGPIQRIYSQTTFHERVKINDRAALEDYGSLEYQKKFDQSVSAGLSRLQNKMESYIGARVIKPGGKEITVSTNEEVLTEDKTSSKAGKLAISELQVGDILDYYIRIEQMQDITAEIEGPYTFFLGGEYPVLYQYLRLQLDEDAGVAYINSNGAPALKELRDADNNIILGLQLRNLPKIQSSVWTSSYRQYPYISLQYMILTRSINSYSYFKRGEVKHGFLSDELLDQFENMLESEIPPGKWKSISKTMGFLGVEKQRIENQDSLVKTLYNTWRFYTFCDFSAQEISINRQYNYLQANSLYSAILVSRLLRAAGIDHEVVLVCPRTSTKLKDVMSLAYFEALIRVKNKEEYWLAFNDIVTQVNEIPARFQGEEGLIFRPDMNIKVINYMQAGKIKIPVNGPGINKETEHITASFNPSDMQQLQIDRLTSLTGGMRHNAQKELLLMEDMEAALATSIHQKKFTERLVDDKKQQKLAAEYNAAFAKEKTNLKSYFEEIINGQYKQEVKELSVYEVKDTGLFDSDFSYHTIFTMENFVKKAGNNYIVEAGKLVGATTKTEEKDRIRSIDVYMPYARNYNYNISLAIPKGYKVKGVENFNKKITNETGSLYSTATAGADAVQIKIEQQYLKNFEPAANWPKLLELMDGFYEITNQKLLLDKSN